MMRLFAGFLYLVPKNLVSFLTGWITRLELPMPVQEWFNQLFVLLAKIDMDEAEQSIGSYSSIDNKLKAGAEVSKILSINPNFSIDLTKLVGTFKKKADLDNVIKALRKAGMPEHSPE